MGDADRHLRGIVNAVHEFGEDPDALAPVLGELVQHADDFLEVPTDVCTCTWHEDMHTGVRKLVKQCGVCASKRCTCDDGNQFKLIGSHFEDCPLAAYVYHDVARCEVTSNPCGTDTWEVNSPCQCSPCRGYAKGYVDGVADGVARAGRL